MTKNLLRLLFLIMLSPFGNIIAQTAANQVSITGSTSAGTIQNNVSTIVDPNILITANGSITDFRITITGSYTTGDILEVQGTLPSGITASAFDSPTRSLLLSGTASAAVWQDLLRRIALRTSSAVCFPEQRQVTFNLGTVYYNVLNGNFYLLNTTTQNWLPAKNQASATSYYGLQGYLTDVSSAGENAFLRAFVNVNSWIGCSDDFQQINAAVGFTKYANQADAEGKFHWVTGPLTGTQMTTANGNGGRIASVYQNWNNNEPNNAGTEHCGHMIASNGLWNDFANSQTIRSIIEFGDMPNDNLTSTVVFTRTININGAPTSSITGGNTSICSGANATLTLTGFSGTVVRWEWSNDNFLSNVNTIANTTTTLNITGLTETRYYRAIVNTTSPSCSGLATSSTAVFVNSTVAGNAISQNPTICAGGVATVSLFGNQGNVVDWQRATNTTFTTGLTTINSTATTIDNVIASAGTYYFRARVQNGSCGSPVNSEFVTITVTSGTPPIGGAVSSVSHCGGTNSGTLTLTGNTGSVQKWQFSTDGGVVWTDVANTTTSLAYSGITQTRLYRAVLTSGACGNAFSNPGTVTVYSFSASNNGPVCEGASLSLGLTAAGGSGPFSYAWTGPSSFSSNLQNPTIANVAAANAGTYNVTVTAPGCTTPVSTTVVVNSSPTITSSTNNFRCGPGTVSLTATGSAGTVRWFDQAVGGTLLTTGTSYTTPSLSSTTSYWVEALSGTCATQPRVEVIATVNTIPIISSFSTGSRCSTGTVNLSATANIGIVRWWSAITSGTELGQGNNFTTPVISSSTTFFAQADNGGCLSSPRTGVNATINSNPTLSISSQTNVACNGGTNGAATIAASVATAPYTYSWSPSGGSAATATGLAAGSYTVTVTSANTCSNTINVIITQPPALSVTPASQTNVACNGGSTGAASINTPTGGTPGYTYNWTPGNPTGDGTTSVTGLSAGVWTCTITDANGCTATQIFTITQPPALSVTPASQTNVACNGGSTGAASINTPTGGTPGYTYNWTPGNPTGDGTTSVTGLAAGTWTCTVTDANGCTATQIFTITQPPALSVTPASQTNVACNGGSTGAASINTPTGGTPGYTYNWTPGNPTGDGTISVTGLAAGTWTCTVTDANGCTATQIFTITQPPALTASQSQTNVACNGGSNGSASVLVSGGTSSYTYSWSPSGGTGATATGLAAGSYTVTITDANGCQITRDFTITQPSIITASITETACDEFVLNGQTYTNSGIFIQNLTAANGCDSTLTLNLTINNSTTSTITETACNTFSLNGQTYTTSGQYIQNLTNAAGCDSTLTLNLTINNSTAATLTETACNTFSLNGQTYTASGQYIQNLTNVAGCDSTLTLNLTINNSTASTITETACNSFALNGQTYTASGQYIQNLTNAAGCDSTLTLNLTINNSTASTITETACNSFSLNGQTYTASGQYIQNLINAAGCDSTLTLNLTINNSTVSTITETACNSFSLNGQTYTASGQYTQNLTNAAGCDSTLTLNLTINNSTAATLTETACNTFSLNGQTYTSSGQYIQNLTNAAGCDSTLTLNLTINNSTASTITETACNSFSLNGQTYTTSGQYIQNLTNAAGCDSTLTLNLTINNSTASTITETACNSFALNGQTYTSSGQYIQNLINAAGCDSTLTLNLTINNSTVSTITETACNSFSLNGQTYTASGQYTQNLTNAAGCDSTLTLNLTINNSTASTITETACNTFALNGQTYTSSGQYIQNLTNAAGCDSTLTLNLTINNSTASTITETACNTFSLNGQTYTSSGQYIQNLTNAAGCDSTLTLNLTINNSTASTITETACNSFALNGQTYTSSGQYIQNLTNAAGCDSTLTLNLTINNSTASTITETACNSFALNGQTYTSSGQYIQNLTNAAGCDSTLTLNLTINNSTASTITETACNSFSLNGQTYTTSGQYIQNLTNAGGCDSTITLNLTVNQATSSILNITAIGSYTLNGQTYTENGQYIQNLTNAAGCDSTITLNLTLNSACEPITVNQTISACGSYSPFEGITLTQTSIYTFNLLTVAGCDSVVVLNLTINQPSSASISQIACGSYNLNGQTYTESGQYIQNLTNAAGCDSTLTLNLTINPVSTTNVSVSACETYTFNGQVYTQSGVYTQLLSNSNGCDSLITLNLTISSPQNETTTVAACQSYTLNGVTYNQSGVYTQETTTAAGCVNTLTINLTINTPSSSQVTASSCNLYQLNGFTYTASGVYTQIISASNGSCDSTITLNLTITNIDDTLTVNGATVTANQAGATYQWFNCSTGAFSNQTGQTFSPPTTGVYGCIITIGNCTKTSECVVVSVPVSISDVQSQIIQVYPNPSEGQFIIELSSRGQLIYEIFTATGQLVEKGQMNQLVNTIDISNQATGVYMLRIEEKTFRIVKN